MAYDEYLGERIKGSLEKRKVLFEAKKMMGGLCFMVDGKMCIGVTKNDLMARIGEEAFINASKRNGCRPMDFTGRPMKGYAFVSPEGVDMDSDLEAWIDLCMAFNPLAKASKKKSKTKSKKAPK